MKRIHLRTYLHGRARGKQACAGTLLPAWRAVHQLSATIANNYSLSSTTGWNESRGTPTCSAAGTPCVTLQRQAVQRICSETNEFLLRAGPEQRHGHNGLATTNPQNQAMSLHEAIEGGKEDLAASLIENGASVTDKDAKGNTSLHVAALKGRAATALLLLQRGADKDSRNAEGKTALHLVGARQEDGWDGWTPSHGACCPLGVADALVNHGADVNSQDNDLCTALHRAVGSDHWDGFPAFEKVKFLLKSGADETIVNDEGMAAMQWLDQSACYHDHWDGIFFDLWVLQAPEIFRRTRELLRNAPADRRWRRRAVLVMSIARHRRGEARLLGRADDGRASDNWSRAAAWVLESGTEGIFRTIVGYL